MANASSEVICKTIEIIPGFKDKTYDSLHHWFIRFRERYSFSIRKVTKLAQQLPTYYLEDIRKYLYNNILEVIEVIKYKTIIANVDETPIYLEPITGTTLEKIVANQVKTRTFEKSKQNISCILCVFADGNKAPPIFVFKGVLDANLEKRLKNRRSIERKIIFQFRV